jgi:hypothetical protein
MIWMNSYKLIGWWLNDWDGIWYITFWLDFEGGYYADVLKMVRQWIEKGDAFIEDGGLGNWSEEKWQS